MSLTMKACPIACPEICSKVNNESLNPICQGLSKWNFIASHARTEIHVCIKKVLSEQSTIIQVWKLGSYLDELKDLRKTIQD